MSLALASGAPVRIPLAVEVPRSHGFRLASRFLTEHIPVPHPPEQNLFKRIFHFITGLLVLNSILAHLNSVWNYRRRRNQSETEEIQTRIELEHWQEWNQNKLAQIRMILILATRDPELFARKFVLSQVEGDLERKKMAGLLKMFNGSYYEQHEEELGDTLEWKDIEDVQNIELGDC